MTKSQRIKYLLLDQKNLIRILFLIVAFGLLLYLLWTIYDRVQIFPQVDFISYWSSARLNAFGGNPYSAEQMLVTEQSVGWKDPQALMILNPPWIFPITMPFGVINHSFSRFLWFLSQMFIIAVSAIFLWRIYSGEKRNEWISWVVFLTFGPLLQALKVGQVTIQVIAGIIGFIYLINRKSDFWAGVLASLVMLKPHLVYLFIILIILWSIYQRRYRVILGMGVAITGSLVISWIVNPGVISQYITAMGAYPLDGWLTSTLGSYIRLRLGQGNFYLQFVPAILGFIWLMIFWARHYKSFDWISYLPLVTLVSLVTSPYGWTFDNSMVIFALLQLVLIFNFKKWTIQKIIIVVSFLLVNFFLTFSSLSQIQLWWIPGYFLIWYPLSYYYLSRYSSEANKPSQLSYV